ncbi:hypothetical protein BC834DRAFT_973724 [Gloeopeniophorella convolvens]|nr:hypothetical protein BC834DRAFT_973724 [Gloeopeniophorella convolvens]
MSSLPSRVGYGLPRPVNSPTRQRGSSLNSAATAPKRRKATSLSGTGRVLAPLAPLKEPEDSESTELVEDSDSAEGFTVDEALRLISKLQSKLTKASDPDSTTNAPPIRHTLPWVADEQLLSDAGIFWSQNLTLCDVFVDQEGIRARAQQSRGLNPPGSPMSSQDLSGLLAAMEGLYSTTAEAGSRIFVNLILLRVAAMFGVGDKRLVVFPEFAVPAVDLTPRASSATRAGGQVDYLAAVAPTSLASGVLASPRILREPCPFADAGLVIVVAKTSMDPDLLNHVPQAILKAAALAKIHNKGRMRGALTTGKQWVFFIFEASPSGEGGAYRHSRPVSIDREDMRDAVTGVLKEWVEASVAE